jgi:uncharacterized protein YgfB (UPF0149 family)
LLSGEQALHFDDFANQMLDEGSEESPSYVHGGVCGVYAAAGEVTAEDCLAVVGRALELGLHGELADSCLRLAAATLGGLMDEEFGYQLFLPDDEEEIEQRVQALADWCRGFLAAFALLVSTSASQRLDEETAESLKDIAAIVEAAVDAEADEEESENQFFELSEYLRFATLNLFANQLSGRDGPATTPDSPGGDGLA